MIKIVMVIYYLNLQNNNFSPYVSFSPTNKSNGPIESLAVNVAKMDSTSTYMYIFGFEYNTTPEKFYYCYNYEGCYFQYSVDKKSRPYQMSVILSYEDYKI